MANKHTTLNGLFSGIADAIRAKKKSTETIVADTFPTEIENLRTGFDYNNSIVTSIADYAFYSSEDLKSVDCYGLTCVGASAFENCTNLKSVILYDNLENVGENAFKGCSKDLRIYYKGTSIPEAWNENWNPDNCLVLIGELLETWSASSTQKDNVTVKLYGADDKCTLLIEGKGEMSNYASDGDTVAPWRVYDNIISIIILEGVTSIGMQAFRECDKLTSITIPEGVTSIGMLAFRECSSLTNITIPNSVTSIGYSAFSRCIELTSITIPDGVTSIDDHTFRECSSLTSVTIPDSVTSIGIYAFYNCIGLTSIVIPDSVKSIGNSAFFNCRGLTSIVIPDGVTSIGDYMFYNCSELTSMTFEGTISQWNAITFGKNWNHNVPATHVQCSDGDVALS